MQPKFTLGDPVTDKLTRLCWRVRKIEPQSNSARYLCCRNAEGAYQTEWFDEAELFEAPASEQPFVMTSYETDYPTFES